MSINSLHTHSQELVNRSILGNFWMYGIVLYHSNKVVQNVEVIHKALSKSLWLLIHVLEMSECLGREKRDTVKRDWKNYFTVDVVHMCLWMVSLCVRDMVFGWNTYLKDNGFLVRRFFFYWAKLFSLFCLDRYSSFQSGHVYFCVCDLMKDTCAFYHHAQNTCCKNYIFFISSLIIHII